MNTQAIDAAVAEPQPKGKAIPPTKTMDPAITNLHPLFAKLVSLAVCKSEELELPEYEVTVLINELDAHGKGALEAAIAKTGKKGDDDDSTFQITDNTFSMRAETILLCVTDIQGNDLITRENIELLGKMPASVIDKMFDAAWELNGMNRKKTEVDTEKKSDPIPA